MGGGVIPFFFGILLRLWGVVSGLDGDYGLVVLKIFSAPAAPQALWGAAGAPRARRRRGAATGGPRGPSARRKFFWIENILYGKIFLGAHLQYS